MLEAGLILHGNKGGMLHLQGNETFPFIPIRGEMLVYMTIDIKITHTIYGEVAHMEGMAGAMHGVLYILKGCTSSPAHCIVSRGSYGICEILIPHAHTKVRMGEAG